MAFKQITAAATILAVVLFFSGVAGAQEVYEPDQDWTWVDDFLCIVFFSNCGGAPCVGPCQTCTLVPGLGSACTSAPNEWGSCRCARDQNADVGCWLYGQACYGVIVYG